MLRAGHGRNARSLLPDDVAPEALLPSGVPARVPPADFRAPRPDAAGPRGPFHTGHARVAAANVGATAAALALDLQRPPDEALEPPVAGLPALGCRSIHPAVD